MGTLSLFTLGTGHKLSAPTVVRKTLIPTVLWILYDFLSLKNDENVPSKISKKTFDVLKVTDEKNRIRIRIHTKNSWIRNTDWWVTHLAEDCHRLWVWGEGELLEPGVPAAQVLRAYLPGQAQERSLRRLAPEHGRRHEVLFIPLDRVVDPDPDKD